jgi:hypothetical protein
MSAVTEAARVRKARLPQSFSSRRVRFARGLALAVSLLLLAAYPIHAQKRRDAIIRLRDDVSAAMAHASLNEKQTQKLDHCRQTLLLSAQAGRARVSSRKDLDGALRDIEKVFHSGPFLPEDRDVVRRDIGQLRVIERNQRARRNPRSRFWRQ